MGRTQYIGARYVPVFADPEEWTNTRAYEPLTVVLHEGNSYTSKQAVPVGIDISNSEFWAHTGNYNAQVEQLRQDVQAIVNELADNIDYREYSQPTIGDVNGSVKRYIQTSGSPINYVRSTGNFENGIGLGTVLNGNEKIQIMGGNTSGIASSYRSRDAVAHYMESHLIPYTLKTESNVFTANSVTVNNANLEELKKGMYAQTTSLDADDSNVFLGTITDIVGNTVYVDGWYSTASGVSGIPENNSTVFFNPLTTIWAENARLIIPADAPENANFIGYEMNLRNNTDRRFGAGFEVISNIGKALYAFFARGIGSAANFLHGIHMINVETGMYIYGAGSVYKYLLKSYKNADGADETNQPDFLITSNGAMNVRRKTVATGAVDSSAGLNVLTVPNQTIDLDAFNDSFIDGTFLEFIIAGNNQTFTSSLGKAITFGVNWNTELKDVLVTKVGVMPYCCFVAANNRWNLIANDDFTASLVD